MNINRFGVVSAAAVQLQPHISLAFPVSIKEKELSSWTGL